MTGEDQPSPAIGVFHFTFSDSDQVVGRPVESECPSQWGPRNWGQLSPARATAENKEIRKRDETLTTPRLAGGLARRVQVLPRNERRNKRPGLGGLAFFHRILIHVLDRAVDVIDRVKED